MDGTQPKRPLRHACYSCQRSHAFCDQERPCGRCVKAGIGEMCFETEMKKRGRKPACETARQRALQDAVHDGRLTLPQRAGNVTRLENISSQEVSPEDLNLVLLNELRELKANQRRLHDELQRLKVNEMAPLPHEQHNTALQKASCTPTPLPVNDKAIVIYDLTKFPATVKTANETFCRMLGYDMQEVLGQPWTKFIHPAYHERVKQLFNTRPLSTIIEFDLVYRHRNGGLFSTFDSHTIIFAADGTPVSDLVAIKLNPHPISAPSPSRPTPLLTGEVATTPVASSSPYARSYAALSAVPDELDTNTQRFHTMSIHDPTASSSRPIAVPGRSPFAPSPPASPMALSSALSAAAVAPSALSQWGADGSLDPNAMFDPQVLMSASPSRFLALSGDDPIYSVSAAHETSDLQPLQQHDVTPLPLGEVPMDPLRVNSFLRSSTDDADLQVNDDELMQLLSSELTGAASANHGT